MAVKIKSITLRWVAGVSGDVDHYIVTRLTDSVAYHPGERIRADIADSLCRSREWKVTVMAEAA